MYWLHYSSNTSHHPSQTPCLPWMSYTTQKFIHARWSKTVWNIPYISMALLPSLKQFYCISSSLDCIFEIHQLWQSGFSRVYSNWFCRCSFEPEILKNCQSSHKMYSNKIRNFQESTTIVNAHTKKVWKLIVCPSYVCLIRKICTLWYGFKLRLIIIVFCKGLKNSIWPIDGTWVRVDLGVIVI